MTIFFKGGHIYNRLKRVQPQFIRKYIVLAIESSCDDTCVALIDRKPGHAPVLLEHIRESLDNSAAGGIIPINALVHHQKHLAKAVQRLVIKAPAKPQVICATRGPGMVASVAEGYSLAKGLSVAWNIPLVGVHHMLGHLITPRFFSYPSSPKFPFLSLLVSGGHTMLVLSKSLLEHKILINTLDIAIGDMLDRCAHELGVKGNMLGKEMEAFINERESLDNLPKDLLFPNPLYNKSGRKDHVAFSYSPFITALRIAGKTYFPTSTLSDLPEEQRRELARRLQYAMFNHLASKVALAIRLGIENNQLDLTELTDLVCSGGVASNSLLRQMLRGSIPESINLHFPDVQWCTDNALMIGWAGIELYEAGLTSELSSLPVAKWPIDEMMSLPGWIIKDQVEPGSCNLVDKKEPSIDS